MASPNYPDVKFALNLDKKGNLKFPSPPPLVTEIECPKCEERPLNLREGKRGPWLGCSGYPKCRGRESWAKLDEKLRGELEKALKKHLKANPMAEITRMDGTPIEEGTPIEQLVVPGGVQELPIHPEAEAASS
ncbi:MAG: topoisomerase DNA-binding C4 zinc finger domain-containing protein [Phycisphaerales bacterium]|nr:topoisomerase DNA-binding C4 zinc finger domain-containing protein [Phycisphaerales bacterium]